MSDFTILKESFSFNQMFFFRFCIKDGRITGSMVVDHSTIFCHITLSNGAL